MKREQEMKKIVLAVSAVAIATMGASALAGDKKSEHKKMSLKEKFEKIDTNGDGVITEGEFTAQGERATPEYFAKMAGDDGQLTYEELKAYKKKKKAHHDKKKKEKHED